MVKMKSSDLLKGNLVSLACCAKWERKFLLCYGHCTNCTHPRYIIFVIIWFIFEISYSAIASVCSIRTWIKRSYLILRKAAFTALAWRKLSGPQIIRVISSIFLSGSLTWWHKVALIAFLVRDLLAGAKTNFSYNPMAMTDIEWEKFVMSKNHIV